VKFEQAVRVLSESGLVVETLAHSHISAAAEPAEPDETIRAQGVSVVYGFGFSLRQVDGTWFLRAGPPGPSEQYPDLAAAVARGLALFREHRERHHA
jgi:hypothetical protein